MARWGFLKRRTTAVWLALIVGGLTALFALNVGSSDLRDEVMTEIKNATERGEVSVDISDIVKDAIQKFPDQSPAEILTRHGFEEKKVVNFDRKALKRFGADYYRGFTNILYRPNWYSYWESKVYLFYTENQLIGVVAHVHLTGL